MDLKMFEWLVVVNEILSRGWWQVGYGRGLF